MASTFGLINSAASGLAAARAALEVTGQNVSNVSTAGYTRQRVDQVAMPGVDRISSFTTGLNIGTGTQITGVSRLSDSIVEARVRDSASSSGYWTAASSALSTVETTLAEPGDNGLSTSLTKFWNAWQAMGNSPGDAAAGKNLIETGTTLASRLQSGYAAAADAWSAGRTAAAGSVDQVNKAGVKVASLNDQILRIEASGGNANELVDQRATAIASLAALTGATTRENANGTVDVLVGGSTFVSGGTAKTLVLGGSASFASVSGFPLTLTYASGGTAQIDGGTLAAQMSALAPASNGSGGIYAETAAAYDQVATRVATQVNAIHTTGQTSTGATGLAFFAFRSTAGPAALNLTVVPTSVSGIAAGATGAGRLDGSVADAIASIGTSAGSPDEAWSATVTRIGSLTQSATTQASIAASAVTAATAAQTSQSGVDLDEETANLVVFQHAYQGAARVLTTIDQMLDTLINSTGLVGR